MYSINDFDTIALQEEVKALYEEADPAHDFSHIMRVYQNAQIIGKKEGADMQVLLFSALLHDAGSVSKGLEDSIESDQRQKAVLDFLIKKGLPKTSKKRCSMPSMCTVSPRELSLTLWRPGSCRTPTGWMPLVPSGLPGSS